MSSVSDLAGFIREFGLHLGAVAVMFTMLVAGLPETVRFLVKWDRRGKIARRSFLLDLLLPIKIAKDAQANLEEVTPLWLKAHGRRRAAFIRLTQIVMIIGGHWLHPALRFFERMLKIMRGQSAE